MDIHSIPPPTRTTKGFLLLEVLIGSAIFIMFSTMSVLILFAGREASYHSGDRVRGTYISDAALEGARNMRNQSFETLVPPSIVYEDPYWIALSGATNLWAYTGAVATYDGNYNNTIALTSLGANWVRVESTTDWKHGYTRSGSIALHTELTDWSTVRNIGDWQNMVLETAYYYDPPPPGTPNYNDVAVKGNYAYVTSDVSNAGKDISVIDISDTDDLELVDQVNLLAAGGQMVIKGNTLYVIVYSNNDEIKVFDISDPENITLTTSYDLPGSSLGLSIAISDDTLLVGSTSHVFGFDISDPSSIVFGEGIDVGGSVNQIRTQGEKAFLATSNATAEMVVLTVNSHDSLLWSGSYDLVAPTPAATTLAITGTSALIGTLSGSAIAEATLLTLPTFAPGPWTFEVTSKVTGLEADPLGCYGFLSSLYRSKELRVLRLSHPPQQLASYKTTTAMGYIRNVRYDPARDRLFAVTDKSLLIFKPGSSSSPCTP